MKACDKENGYIHICYGLETSFSLLSKQTHLPLEALSPFAIDDELSMNTLPRTAVINPHRRRTTLNALVGGGWIHNELAGVIRGRPYHHGISPRRDTGQIFTLPYRLWIWIFNTAFIDRVFHEALPRFHIVRRQQTTSEKGRAPLIDPSPLTILLIATNLILVETRERLAVDLYCEFSQYPRPIKG